MDYLNMLIAFEGLDGTGKTTISKFLYVKLKQYFAHVSWYPIDMRKIITSADAADPIISYEYYLDGLKEYGKNDDKSFVIFDRYYLSALGYRILRNNENINFVNVSQEIKKILEIIPKPDITFILETSHRNRIGNIAKKNIIDNYDLSSLKKDNIIFWKNFYRQDSEQLMYIISHDNNIEKTVDLLFNIIWEYIFSFHAFGKEDMRNL